MGKGSFVHQSIIKKFLVTQEEKFVINELKFYLRDMRVRNTLALSHRAETRLHIMESA